MPNVLQGKPTVVESVVLNAVMLAGQQYSSQQNL